jgi:RNA polymerase sigma-70 factor, ECF subfamily
MPDAGTTTLLLQKIRSGDRAAESELFDILYDDLRRLAAHFMKGERSSHTLQPTALVNEAYLRIFGDTPVPIRDRHHFLALAGAVMRRLLVDHARAHQAAKRGAGLAPATFDDHFQYDSGDPARYLALDQALSRLHEQDPRQCQIVEMRYFAGLTEAEIAESLEISERTVKRDWQVARAWLHAELTRSA